LKNIAVIGSGYWGKNLVRNFAELDALHTICDTDAAVLEAFAAKYPGVALEADYARVLNDAAIKGVVIAAPAALHYNMARQALLAGKDVLVEKPLSLRVEEGRELVGLAGKSGRVLMVGHLLEYHPAVLALRDMVNRGELGKIRYLYSNRLNLGKIRTEEDIMWSFAPHDIAVLLLMMGGELPQRVSAHGGYYLHKDIADVTMTNMDFKDGIRAHIFVSWLHPYKEQKLVVVGEKSMVVFDDSKAEEKLCRFDHEIEWVERKPVPHPHQCSVCKVEMQEPLRLECQDFIGCIETRGRPRVDGAKGLQVLEVLDACRRSLLQDGAPVMLTSGDSHYYMHETSLVERPLSIGKGAKIWHFAHVMPGASIGEGCNIGQNVFIAGGVRIGDRVKIQNNVSVYEGVELEDDVFCGPSCVFTNVNNPRSFISRKNDYRHTLVKKGASIGANATIVCGNTVGQYAFVGAGAVVTHDVPNYAMVYGNPARRQGWVCRCGVKLKFNSAGKAACEGCGGRYRKMPGGETIEEIIKK
jgi:UDP-2-acetamido-3-amino-2,3-dideoxy-glucuronate N-acetyltransferase